MVLGSQLARRKQIAPESHPQTQPNPNPTVAENLLASDQPLSWPLRFCAKGALPMEHRVAYLGFRDSERDSAKTLGVQLRVSFLDFLAH